MSPLIELFDDLYDDDWALSDLGQVMGMIGEAAIDPLASFLNESHHPEFARVIAVDGLAKVAQTYPEYRECVIRKFRDYMASPDTSGKTLNGLMVGKLLDLEAVELIDDIRRMFEIGCVDIYCAGDLQDVEIELGLRSERSTPEPDYRGMYGLDSRSAPESDDLYADVDFYFSRYGSDDSILGVVELDGFYAALACAPELIRPSRWMPALWGGEALSPAWESLDEANRFMATVMVLYNDVIDRLARDTYEPLFYEHDVDGKTYIIVDEWCEGFLRGVCLWGNLSQVDKAALEEFLLPISLFATTEGFEALESMNETETGHEQAKIEPAVRGMYLYFRAQRKQAPITFVRDRPKVGRNDPCPCGSGKKYKHCCLH